MADLVDKATRSRMMAAIPSRDTSPEVAVRKGLHVLGFRRALRVGRLPGSPDLVYPKHRAAVFVHGCFWHGHRCRLFRWPKSNADFWTRKILGNRKRDTRACRELRKLGWKPLVVWECSIIKAAGSGKLGELMQALGAAIRKGLS